jgi:hypothetical protein
MDNNKRSELFIDKELEDLLREANAMVTKVFEWCEQERKKQQRVKNRDKLGGKER